MRIEIDFDNKTIEVKDSTTLGELVDKLKELKLDWKEFKLKVGVEYISYPWYVPYTTYPIITYISPNTHTIAPTVNPYEITCGAVTTKNMGVEGVDWHYTN